MPAQPQQPRGDEGSLDFLWLIVLIVAAALLIWYFGRTYIETGVLYVKLAEIAIVKFVLSYWSKIAYFLHFLHLPQPNLQILDNLTVFIKQKFAIMDFDTLVKVSKAIGDYLRYPMSLILLGSGIYLYFGNVKLKFTNIFTMKKLRNLEKENWPRVMPVANLDLVKKDLDKGSWAMALTPMPFCKKYNLLKEEIEDGKPKASLIRGKAFNVLALQLGPIWNGRVDTLPIHMQALLAIFAARTDNDINNADKLLDQIALSSVSGKLNFAGSKALLARHINAKPVVKKIGKHAYMLTMMASMLDLARSMGVLASADFLWLKPLDRRLWYVLNSVGRQTAVPEVAGVFGHWIAELKLGNPIKVPMVDTAVNGLTEAISEVLYEPEED